MVKKVKAKAEQMEVELNKQKDELAVSIVEMENQVKEMKDEQQVLVEKITEEQQKVQREHWN